LNLPQSRPAGFRLPLLAQEASWLPLLPILALALLLRIGYMPGLGYSPDMFNSTGWIKTIQQRGLFNFYTDEALRTYPPIAIAAHGAIGLVQQAAGLALDPVKDSVYLSWLKVPSVVTELALIAVVYAWLRRERWLRWTIPGLLAIHPGLVVTSAWWGQNESMYMLPVVLALIALNRERPMLAWGCFALALLTKQQSVVLFPLMLILTFRRCGWRTAALGILSATVLVAVIYAPFVLASGFDSALSPYLGAADRYPDVTNNAYNFWQLLIPLGRASGLWPDGSPFTDALPILGPLTLKQAGLLMLGAYTLLIGMDMWKRPREKREFVWASALYYGAFMLPTQIHERYLYAGAILIVIALAQDRRLWWVALGTLYTYTNNVLQVAARFTFLGLTAYYVNVSTQVALLNLLFLVELTRVVFLHPVLSPSLLAEGGQGGEVRSHNFTRSFIRLAAVLVTATLVLGLIAEAANQRATAQWLADHVPDMARLAADGQAEGIVALTRQWPNARTWDWQIPWNVDEKPVVQWQGEGVRFLLVDERTYPHDSLPRRIQRLLDQGATLAYQSNNLFGLGAHQAVLSLEKK
jgi:Gpi18-like mannosyltransferase